MKQEEKDLLLKDLCARLPFDPIIYVNDKLPRLKVGAATRIWEYIAVDNPCKPYLRPMSSRTSDESKIYDSICRNWPEDWTKRLDFYLKYHFDYRGLIEKGLALEAPDGMY